MTLQNCWVRTLGLSISMLITYWVRCDLRQAAVFSLDNPLRGLPASSTADTGGSLLLKGI